MNFTIREYFLWRTMLLQHHDLAKKPHAMTDTGRQDALDQLYKHGMAVRRQVVGDTYVDAALRSTAQGRITGPTQEYVTAACWGGVWARQTDVLSHRDRSLMNLCMLCCLNRGTELATHVRGALRNGVTEAEIGEVMLQVCVYAGAPAGLEGCRIAERVIAEWHKEQTEEKK